MEFKTQRDIAKSIIESGNCVGIHCNGGLNQPVACPLKSYGSTCTSETAARWLQENGESEEPNNLSFEATNSPGVDGDPGEGGFRAEEPKKFGDLDPQEQEVIRKAYAEGRCEFLCVDTWDSVSDDSWRNAYGPFNTCVYRISEPQHQSDTESEETGSHGIGVTSPNSRLDILDPHSHVETFDSGAVRDTNANKPRPELISPFFTERLAQVLAEGAEKYDDDNWSKGIPMRRCLASLERHIMKFKMGLTDEDHLGNAAANIMFLIHFDALRPDLNDMPKYELR